MLALIGVIIIACVLLGIMSKKMSPLVALIGFPFLGALIMGYGPAEASKFVIMGLKDIIPVTGMIIFAILYFGVVSDAGMLDPIIKGILRAAGCNPARITVGTALLALIIHLDGSGAVTIMLTVPAVMPLYDRLGMDRRILACIIALSAGTNFLPWVGALVRSSIVLKTPSTEIFFPLIPVQIVGLVGVFAIAYWFGKREEKRLGLDAEQNKEQVLTYTLTEQEQAMRRPQFFWPNLIITLAVITCMIFHVVDAVVAFMLGMVLALSLNYRNVNEQMARIEAHAKTALMLGSILMSAGVFVGIMGNTGTITALAEALVTIIPDGMEGHMPFIVGILSMPMSLFFDPDSFYFGVMPVIAEAYKTLGGDPVLIGRAAILGVHTTGFGVSPLTPSCFLLIGMTGLNLADHQRFSLPFLWGITILMTVSAAMLGVFPF
ncbi:citrate:proton symporter [Desulfovibrio sp. OttesenSCG-928-O18]|nr:citrate:proton symporter [Desulfovibrio sp. OttesenSCG-928-O18]